MISSLKGTIQEVLDHSLIIDVNGVGYEVFTVPAVLQSIQTGDEMTIYTHLHIREDAHTLFGFSSLEERDMFRKLVGISGVGPKSALGALSAAPLPQLIEAIRSEDHQLFSNVPGIGAKIAKRLVMELKSVVDGMDVAPAGQQDSAQAGGTSSHRADLTAALEELGYGRQEIQEMLAGGAYDGMPVEEAIKEVLRRG